LTSASPTFGSLTFQVAVTLLLLVAAEVVLRKRGGLSWPLHLLVRRPRGDVLGTDGDLYANIGAYDN
jgi:hypothetical protein